MFCKGPKVFRSRCKNHKNSRLFSKKILKASIWTGLCSFNTPWKKFFPKNQKYFGQSTEKLEKPKLFPKKFSICFPGHVNFGFENPIVNCLLNRKKSFPPIDQNGSLKAQKLQENHLFQKCFSSKTFPGHVRWSSEKRTAKLFANSSRNFKLKVRQIFPQGTRDTKKPLFFH